MLGKREESVYGSLTMEEIHGQLEELGDQLGVEIDTFQSNHEGEIVDALQGAVAGGVNAIVINPAAYTHTSIAIRDALLAIDIPYYEVHISNIHSREPFRHKSLISDGAAGIVVGFGPAGYSLALRGLHESLTVKRTEEKQ
jgi:3-dehydroquinate dehydratase-2